MIDLLMGRIALALGIPLLSEEKQALIRGGAALYNATPPDKLELPEISVKSVRWHIRLRWRRSFPAI